MSYFIFHTESINNAAMEPWGIKCLRYEIKDIELPSKVKEAMQMQVEAERRKRAVVLESEGIRCTLSLCLCFCIKLDGFL